mgnify:CR=1 FL=1
MNIKESIAYRAMMRRLLRSGMVHEAGKCWIEMELANHEREMREALRRKRMQTLLEAKAKR